MNYRDDDPMEIAEFISSHGEGFRRTGNQYVGTCFLCGKPGHFYMNAESSQADCKRCGWTGNLAELKKELGLRRLGKAGDFGRPFDAKPEPPPPPLDAARIKEGMTKLHADPQAMDYLAKRGIAQKVIQAMGLVLEESHGLKFIGFPWWDPKVKAWNGMKLRLLPNQANTEGQPRFKRLKGYKSLLYNAAALDYVKRGERPWRIILCSGETDLLTLLSMGITNVVATTTGETALPNEHVAQLQEMDEVIVLFDSDEAGRKGAENVVKKVGRGIARIAALPKGFKDVNELWTDGEFDHEEAKSRVRYALDNSASLDIPTVKHLVEIIPELKAGFFGGSEPVEPWTPWETVNEQLQRFHGLIILSAPQNTGKTTWGLNVCDWWSSRNKPALFYCLEMSAEELVAKVAMANYRVDLRALQANQDYFDQMARDYADRPFYIGYAPEARTVKDVLQLLQEAIQRYSLEILFFDNIHVMARGRDPRAIVGELSIGLKRLAMDNGITVVGIAQPRKLESGAIMSRWDLKESVDLASDADNIILLHRQQVAAKKDVDAYDEKVEAVLSPYTLVRVEKTRFGGSKDTILHLDGPHHRFRELYAGEVVEYRGKRGSWKTSSSWAVEDPANPFIGGDTTEW